MREPRRQEQLQAPVRHAAVTSKRSVQRDAIAKAGSRNASLCPHVADEPAQTLLYHFLVLFEVSPSSPSFACASRSPARYSPRRRLYSHQTAPSASRAYFLRLAAVASLFRSESAPARTIDPFSRRLMEASRYARRRLILADLEDAVGALGSIAGAPSGNKGARQGGVVELDRDRVVHGPRKSAGAIVQPSAPQFASSHVCI